MLTEGTGDVGYFDDDLVVAVRGSPWICADPPPIFPIPLARIRDFFPRSFLSMVDDLANSLLQVHLERLAVSSNLRSKMLCKRVLPTRFAFLISCNALSVSLFFFPWW